MKIFNCSLRSIIAVAVFQSFITIHFEIEKYTDLNQLVPKRLFAVLLKAKCSIYKNFFYKLFWNPPKRFKSLFTICASISLTSICLPTQYGHLAFSALTGFGRFFVSFVGNPTLLPLAVADISLKFNKTFFRGFNLHTARWPHPAKVTLTTRLVY